MGNELLDQRCPVTSLDLVEARHITEQGYLNGYDMLRVHGPWSRARNADGTAVDAGKQPRAGWRDPGHLSRSLPRLLNVSPLLCNTGIVTGSVRALDIDIDDADLCRRYLEAALGRSGLLDSYFAGLIPHRGRCNSSKCLLALRCDDPTRGKVSVAGDNGHKVEILGNGQQFIAHGWHSSDMNGGVRLTWWPRPTWEIPVTDLVVMTQEIEQAFVEVALETLPGARLGVGKQARNEASGGRQAATGNSGNLLDASATPDELIHIARLLPNTVVDWEFWNTNLLRFFASSHGSDAGLAAASAWSNKIFAKHRELQPKYTVEERWNYWRRSPASAPSHTGTGALILAVREAIGDPHWYFAPSQPRQDAAAAATESTDADPRRKRRRVLLASEPSQASADPADAASGLLQLAKERFEQSARDRGARAALGDMAELLAKQPVTAAQILHKIIYFALGKGCGSGLRLLALEQLIARLLPQAEDAARLVAQATTRLARKDTGIASRGRRVPAHRRAWRRS